MTMLLAAERRGIRQHQKCHPCTSGYSWVRSCSWNLVLLRAKCATYS